MESEKRRSEALRRCAKKSKDKTDQKILIFFISIERMDTVHLIKILEKSAVQT